MYSHIIFICIYSLNMGLENVAKNKMNVFTKAKDLIFTKRHESFSSCTLAWKKRWIHTFSKEKV